jgi:hypothetical protein
LIRIFNPMQHICIGFSYAISKTVKTNRVSSINKKV